MAASMFGPQARLAIIANRDPPAVDNEVELMATLRSKLGPHASEERLLYHLRSARGKVHWAVNSYFREVLGAQSASTTRLDFEPKPYHTAADPVIATAASTSASSAVTAVGHMGSTHMSRSSTDPSGVGVPLGRLGSTHMSGSSTEAPGAGALGVGVPLGQLGSTLMSGSSTEAPGVGAPGVGVPLGQLGSTHMSGSSTEAPGVGVPVGVESMRSKGAMTSPLRRATSDSEVSAAAQLPGSLVEEVMKHLDLHSLCAAAMVCRTFRLAASSNEIWRCLYCLRWGSYIFPLQPIAPNRQPSAPAPITPATHTPATHTPAPNTPAANTTAPAVGVATPSGLSRQPSQPVPTNPAPIILAPAAGSAAPSGLTRQPSQPIPTNPAPTTSPTGSAAVAPFDPRHPRLLPITGGASTVPTALISAPLDAAKRGPSSALPSTSSTAPLDAANRGPSSSSPSTSFAAPLDAANAGLSSTAPNASVSVSLDHANGQLLFGREASCATDAVTTTGVACVVPAVPRTVELTAAPGSPPVGGESDKRVLSDATWRVTGACEQLGVAGITLGSTGGQAGTSESRVGLGESKVGLGESRLGSGESRLGLGESRLGLGESRLGMGESRLGLGESRPALSESRLGVEGSRPGIGESSMGTQGAGEKGKAPSQLRTVPSSTSLDSVSTAAMITNNDSGLVRCCTVNDIPTPEPCTPSEPHTPHSANSELVVAFETAITQIQQAIPRFQSGNAPTSSCPSSTRIQQDAPRCAPENAPTSSSPHRSLSDTTTMAGLHTSIAMRDGSMLPLQPPRTSGSLSQLSTHALDCASTSDVSLNFAKDSWPGMRPSGSTAMPGAMNAPPPRFSPTTVTLSQHVGATDWSKDTSSVGAAWTLPYPSFPHPVPCLSAHNTTLTAGNSFLQPTPPCHDAPPATSSINAVNSFTQPTPGSTVVPPANPLINANNSLTQPTPLSHSVPHHPPHTPTRNWRQTYKTQHLFTRHMQCPKCGNHRIVPIIYGFPSPALLLGRQHKRLILGGDHLIDRCHVWACTGCNAGFRYFPFEDVAKWVEDDAQDAKAAAANNNSNEQHTPYTYEL